MPETMVRICSGDTVKLYAPSISNAEYKWTGPDGFSIRPAKSGF